MGSPLKHKSMPLILNKYFFLTVLGKGLKVLPEHRYFKRNETVTLSCVSVTDQSRVTPVSWFKNHLHIFSDNYDVIINNDNGSLTIAKFQQQDEGYYHCETSRGKFRQSPLVAVILSGELLSVKASLRERLGVKCIDKSDGGL